MKPHNYAKELADHVANPGTRAWKCAYQRALIGILTRNGDAEDNYVVKQARALLAEEEPKP